METQSEMTKKKALIMLLGDASGDPRPRRFIDLLISSGYQVDVLGEKPARQLSVNNYFTIKKPKGRLAILLNKAVIYLKRILTFFGPIGFVNDYLNNVANGLNGLRAQLEATNYDLIIVEDLYLLSSAKKIARGAKLIFDAREYYPLQNEERFLWRLLEKPDRIRVCKELLPKCDYVLTVSPGLAERYDQEFGTSCQVFRSVPFYRDNKPKDTSNNHIRIVHHGIANPNRELEKMIDVVRLLDQRFSFDMYLTGTASYIEILKNYAQNLNNVRICDPVPYDQLDSMLTSGYDIGFFYNEPLTFNLRHSLPNKIFEFIQARLAVAIGPSPDMAEVVNTYGCGVVSKSFSITAMAETLNALHAEGIDKMKAKSDLAARELNYEKESLRFITLLNTIDKNDK